MFAQAMHVFPIADAAACTDHAARRPATLAATLAATVARPKALLRIAVLLSAVGWVAAAVDRSGAVRAAEQAGASPRTWTDSTGKHTIEATLVGVADGQVRLRRADGQVVALPLTRLSEADRRYAVEHARQDAVPPTVSGHGHHGDEKAPGGRGASQESHEAKQAAEDGVELRSGAVVRGRIVVRDDEQVTLQTEVNGRLYTRKYPLDRLRAVTRDGKREVLDGAGVASGDAPDANDGGSSAARSAASGAAATGPGGPRRSKGDIVALVERQGKAPPDWWDATPLDYPQSLDLAWPEPAPGPWNAQKNVGQYLWDVIYPNPSKWREGIRLVHHLLILHQRDPRLKLRAIETLAQMYQDLLQDYPRAVFWWRRALAIRGNDSPHGTKLAECYWRLGNKAMAMEVLAETPIYYSTIKLLADMGETRRALELADSAANAGPADLAYLYAGDACRLQRRYAEAIDYYRRVLQVTPEGQAAERTKRNHVRAQAAIEAIRLVDSLDLARVPDGKYRARSPAYAGELEVEVTVKAGRIVDVRVTAHQEKQFYSALTDTTRKIVERQGVGGIDATSSATITSEAILHATTKAISQAMQ